jgi:aminopeptidase-like protein
MLENNVRYLNQNPKCEPQLGKRGLYHPMGVSQQGKDFQMALLWILNYSDSNHTLLDIAEKSGISFGTIKEAADALLRFNLLKEV